MIIALIAAFTFQSAEQPEFSAQCLTEVAALNRNDSDQPDAILAKAREIRDQRARILEAVAQMDRSRQAVAAEFAAKVEAGEVSASFADFQNRQNAQQRNGIVVQVQQGDSRIPSCFTPLE